MSDTNGQPLPWPAEPVSFFVAGIPQTQGHKRAIISHTTGRAVVVESSKRELTAWRKLVRQTAMRWVPARLRGPVRVHITFRLQAPQHIPKERAGWPATRPDIDTLTRAVLDALTGVCFWDDGQVVELAARKLYAESSTPLGAGIKVGPL